MRVTINRAVSHLDADVRRNSEMKWPPSNQIFKCVSAIFLPPLPACRRLRQLVKMPQLSSAERLKVNIWKYEASMCVSLSLPLPPSVSRPMCFQMIKWVHWAAGEPTPTWGPCGEVLDLAQEEQEALSEARGTTKTSAAQRTPRRERRSSHLEIRPLHLFVPRSSAFFAVWEI